MNVVYCFSPNWFQYFLVSAFSLFSNNNERINLYMFSDEIPKEELDKAYRLAADFGGQFYPFVIDDNKFNNVNSEPTRFTKYALYRLLMPSLIQVDKALYLDTDTIVCAPLDNLYNINMEENLIAGVIDIGISQIEKNAINLKPEDPYFNSGVLLMNLKEFREQSLDYLLPHIANTEYYRFHDQCILNKMTKDKKVIVHNSYNVSVATHSLKIEERDIKIIHYVGYKAERWVDGLPFFGIYKKWERRYFEYENNH